MWRKYIDLTRTQVQIKNLGKSKTMKEYTHEMLCRFSKEHSYRDGCCWFQGSRDLDDGRWNCNFGGSRSAQSNLSPSSDDLDAISAPQTPSEPNPLRRVLFNTPSCIVEALYQLAATPIWPDARLRLTALPPPPLSPSSVHQPTMLFFRCATKTPHPSIYPPAELLGLCKARRIGCDKRNERGGVC